MLEAALRRDRLVVAAGLGALSLLAWIAVARMAATSAGDMSTMAMPVVAGTGEAKGLGLAWLIGMWSIMMVAMMLPSAAPMILLFAGVTRRRRQEGRSAVPAAVFTLGYLLVWTAYAAIAGTAQWELNRRALLSPAMASVSPLLAGGLLIAAGVYQWLPLKAGCLTHCRSPLGFFSHEWREGLGGALLMGVRHGTYCVGCCWLLMALLFVAGVMNLLWVAVLAGFVLLEKLVRGGPFLGRIAGAALVWWGLWVLWA
jgi:predicted metal-binding membrane protein